MKCSVVVISWNAMQYIPACLENLQLSVGETDTVTFGIEPDIKTG